MEAKERARRLYCLVVMFFIVSLIGWLLETVNFIVIGSPMDRGYLTLPLCTVYGCALLAVYFAVGTPTKGRLRPLFERCRALSPAARVFARIGLILLYFVIVTVLSSAVEFITGLIFEKGFGVTLWSYSGYHFNIMGYVCLSFSLLWGVLITVGMGTVWPLLMKLVERMSYRTVKRLSIVLLVLLGGDFIFSTSYLFTTGKRFRLF